MPIDLFLVLYLYNNSYHEFMHVPRNPPNIEQLFDNSDMLRCIFSEDVGRYATEFNRRYLHWSEVRFRDTGPFNPDAIWARMKIVRLDNGSELVFGGRTHRYHVTDGMMRMLHEFDLKASIGLFPENVDSNRRVYYSVSSLMEESISSSQMEGAVTTTKVAKEMLRRKTHPKDRSQRMIVNNYKAMTFVKQGIDRPLTLEFMMDVHRIVTHETLDEGFIGRFRDNDDVVVQDVMSGEVFHQPMPHDLIVESLQQLCDFINDETEFIHPLIKGIILHYMVAYIHPFEDGNGRVARTLFYWYELKSGYWIMEYLVLSKYIRQHKGKYEESYVFVETDDNDMNYFILYNLKALMDSIAVFEDYLKRKIREERDTRAELAGHGLNERQIGIVLDLMNGGSITVKSIQNQYGVSLNTSRSDIKVLIEAGLLKECGREVNARVYSWSGVGCNGCRCPTAGD